VPVPGVHDILATLTRLHRLRLRRVSLMHRLLDPKKSKFARLPLPLALAHTDETSRLRCSWFAMYRVPPQHLKIAADHGEVVALRERAALGCGHLSS
jgi:hypothetical protein